MRFNRLLFTIVAGPIVTGCSLFYVVRPGRPGIPLAATISTFSSIDKGQEQAPRILPSETLLDQATLSVEPNRTCANVQLRQPVAFDLPATVLVMRCSNGPEKAEAVIVTEQESTLRDYPFTGEAPQLDVYGFGVGLTVPVGPREERIFRVAERSFAVCCPLTAGEVFKLTISGRFGRRGSSIRTDFLWRLQLPPE